MNRFQMPAAPVTRNVAPPELPGAKDRESLRVVVNASAINRTIALQWLEHFNALAAEYEAHAHAYRANAAMYQAVLSERAL